jgi:hypothetical protein
MGLQAVHSFELAAPMMLELISDITLADRFYVITVFGRAYLHQREALTGGDEKLEIEGRSFSVWTRSARPLTAIEVSLFSWLKDDSHQVAQQVAAQTFAVLVTTELERRERELLARRWTESAAQTSQVSATSSMIVAASEPERLRKLHPLGWMAVFLTAPKEKELRTQIWPVMAEVIQMQQGLGGQQQYEKVAASLQGKSTQPQVATSALVPTVLYRWGNVVDTGVKNLSHTLGRALEFYRYRWLILGLVFVGYLIACSAVKSWVSDLAQPSRPAATQQPAEPVGNR